MREILFRGKNTINGNWVYGYYFVDEGIHKIHSGHTVYPVHPKTVGQFTGELDTIGNKIFEDDTVRHDIKSKYLVKSDWLTVEGKVEMIEGTWCVSKEHYPLYAFENTILGNIHDK